MDEQHRREEAVRRYEQGEVPIAIYQSLGRSKAWFFKWVTRAQQDGANWATTRSRRPQRSPHRIPPMVERAVIETRKQLEQRRYAQVGAWSIQWQLRQQGVPAPSLATINRILTRHQLVQKSRPYRPKGIPYPTPDIPTSNVLHQFDVLGPRYLSTDGRFYAANLIDAYDRRCSVNPLRRQTKIEVTKALLRAWRTLGIPRYLQLDNQLPFRGSNRYPRSFGLVLRLCLHLGIQPVFIPPREPWRNGIIERFQQVFEKGFFRAQPFASFSDLCQEASVFEAFHNQHHRYSTLAGQTPEETVAEPLTVLPDDFRPPKKLTIPPGLIHVVRFIRSTRTLDVFGETFAMPPEVEYEYVWSTIDTANETLSVSHDGQQVEQFVYPLPKTSLDVSRLDL
ncbi:MAG: integrase core domain-containing protein [Nitrospiraceae bacterium]